LRIEPWRRYNISQYHRWHEIHEIAGAAANIERLSRRAARANLARSGGLSSQTIQ
jgi:hypothetical protein